MNIRFCIVPLVCALLSVSAFAGNGLAAKTHAAKKSHRSAEKAAGDETVGVPGKVIQEPNSFHGVKWGTPMASVPDLTVVEKDGQAAYATVAGVVYRIGDAFLSDVVYGFCQGKFAAVMVEYKGRKAHASIRDFLAAKYTKPLEMDGHPDDLAWPLGNVFIRMSFSKEKDTGSLSYFYQPLFAPCAGPDGNKAAQ
ncbi:conserved hypothetical protein [Solidesulfovibrio fructosivorans JJ]]|uniref:Uncharacterized protein n=1 Tax=Solidesulfovibrio fructosivorans JJ] TaxID=596151 RepID=E1K2L8_SOLFR|nr:hypothetical protein [Solidesulfovibrio fructosivorans]EFL49150.1 conserved hypothetical protein [Solidesulfovibrio fructosivorans JJ]]